MAMFDEWSINPISIGVRTEGVVMVEAGWWWHDVGIFNS
jgi:hypothetical protein